jgi:hypothetical protein
MENLLFDSFRRQFPLGPEGTSLAMARFHGFSAHLRENDITVAFEAVCREMLGDHGQKPLLNYMVVTAVVDKQKPYATRFRDSRGVIEFCAAWGLPWNETFLFHTTEAFMEYWKIYDELARDGTAGEIIGALSSAANSAVPSPVPHVEVQGEILEGMVARIVHRRDIGNLLQLAAAVTSSVPLTRLKEVSGELDYLWETSGRDSDVFMQWAHKRVAPVFPRQLSGAMSHEATNRLVSGLMSSSGHHQHRTTDQMCELLGEIWCPEQDKTRCHLKGFAHNDGSVCIIIHVAGDEVFAEVNKSREPGQMPLYRGFVVRVSVSSAPNASSPRASSPGAVNENEQMSSGVHLMVKCKTVRYKIMTFVLRKGAQLYMKAISLKKPVAAALKRYEDNVQHYFTQWAADEAEVADLQKRYGRFVGGWPVWLQHKVDAGVLEPQEFLAAKHYLGLAEEYKRWFEEQTATADAPFRGLLVISYPATKVPDDPEAPHLKLLARHPMQVTVVAAKDINRRDMATIVAGANVLPIALCDRAPPGSLETALEGFGCDICWLSAAAPPGLEMDLAAAKPGDIKRLMNISPRWTRLLGAVVPAGQTLVDDRTRALAGGASLEALLAATQATPATNDAVVARALEVLAPGRPRQPAPRNTVVLFPSLPGTAKSHLCTGEGLRRISEGLAALPGEPELLVLHGDAPEHREGSFWKKLLDLMAARRPYATHGGRDCVIICDKNCPPGLVNEAPGTDGHHRQIAVKYVTKGTHLVLVAPRSAGLQQHGEVNAYCLEVLAVCILRVLTRTAHENLQGPQTGLVVTMFQNMYSHVTRERFERRLEALGTVLELPLLLEPRPPLPEELQRFLLRGMSLDRQRTIALGRAQGLKRAKGKTSASVPQVSDNLQTDIDAWTRLCPEMIGKHHEYLAAIQSPEGDVTDTFVDGLLQAITNPKEVVIVSDEPNYCGVFVSREQMVHEVKPRARSRRRFAPPLIHFTPDSRAVALHRRSSTSHRIHAPSPCTAALIHFTPDSRRGSAPLSLTHRRGRNPR